MSLTAGIAALGSLKSLYELAREMRDSNDPEKLRVAAAQMFDLALAAREQTAALQEERNTAMIELATLKAEIEKADQFDKKAENYAREMTHTGATVYREKGAGGVQGQSPYYCPHCFDNRNISIMNPAPASHIGGQHPYVCPRCKTSIPLYKLRMP